MPEDEGLPGLRMFRGVSEFGLCLSALVDRVDGAYAAILADDLGEAVDFAHHETSISALDLQLHAAQLMSVMTALEQRVQFGGQLQIVEAQRATLLTLPTVEGLRITLLAARPCNLAQAEQAIAIAAREISGIAER